MDFSSPPPASKRLQMAGVDPSAIANNQTDVPLAHQIGEGIGALVWISPIYSATATPVPNQTPPSK